MPNYADVSNGVCVNVFVADESFRPLFEEFMPDDLMVGPLDDLDPEPGISWLYNADTSTWSPPPDLATDEATKSSS